MECIENLNKSNLQNIFSFHSIGGISKANEQHWSGELFIKSPLLPWIILKATIQNMLYIGSHRK
jgi:hypothetical protein